MEVGARDEPQQDRIEDVVQRDGREESPEEQGGHERWDGYER